MSTEFFSCILLKAVYSKVYISLSALQGCRVYSGIAGLPSLPLNPTANRGRSQWKKIQTSFCVVATGTYCCVQEPLVHLPQPCVQGCQGASIYSILCGMCICVSSNPTAYRYRSPIYRSPGSARLNYGPKSP
jgi:hypothetical protein